MFLSGNKTDIMMVKIHQQMLKILSSRTTGPVLIKFSKKHPWLVGFK